MKVEKIIEERGGWKTELRGQRWGLPAGVTRPSNVYVGPIPRTPTSILANMLSCLTR